jgi:putative ABC transport system permease protein
MIRLAWQQLRTRMGRGVALLCGVALATSGFTVLTGSVETSRLAAAGVVEVNSRAAYDLLVRPRGSRSLAETERGLVRPNHISGAYGGISVAQWQQIRAVAGVQVAAPIVMIGYAAAAASAELDLTSSLEPTQIRQIVRLRARWAADAGLTAAAEKTPRFVYVTRRPVAVPEAIGVDDSRSPGGYRAPDGTVWRFADLWRLGCTEHQVPYPYLEQREDGRWLPICGTWKIDTGRQKRSFALNQAQFFVFQALPNGRFLDFSHVLDPSRLPGPDSHARTTPRATTRVRFSLDWPLWLPVAAVDPDQEARLVGLDRAVTSGRYLPRAQVGCPPIDRYPVLVPRRVPVAERLTVATDRVPVSANQVLAVTPVQLLDTLNAADGTGTGANTYEAADVYGPVLNKASAVRLDVTLQSAAPTYTVDPHGTQQPVPVRVPADSWRTPVSLYGEVATGPSALQPYLARDGGFRRLSPTAVRPPTDVVHPPRAVRVGTFDADRLREFSSLAAVPLETYRAPDVTGADRRSRSLLSGGKLPPGNNPAGYVAAPPSMLMSLDAARCLLDRPNPISAVRVRVAGVSGIDAVSRERVRLVAETVANRTGLDVDVTLGSSPQWQRVQLPAGGLGRPELLLNEGWSKQGVALSVTRAVDRKRVFLLSLILIVCLLFLGTATSAAVRDRYRELAILSCVGWPGWRRGALILSETAMVGLAAGALGFGVSVPVARTQGIELSWTRGLIAIPVALALVVTAAAAPAVRAAKAYPAAALHPPKARAGKARVRGSRWGLAAVNLARTPGRTLTATLSLAIGAAGLLLLLAVLWAFDGAVVGTLLGDAVALRARVVDAAAVIATVVLAVGAVADVFYLGVRERAAEFATLWATGWTSGQLSAVILREAAIVSLLGAGLGVGGSLTAAAGFAGGLSSRLILVAVATAAATATLAMIASIVPVLLLRRLPMATLLSEE